MTPVDAVVFDIGNVLLRWDPRNLFRKLLADEEQIERFLAEICTGEWNLEQDRGRSWDEAVRERVALFPEHEPLIRAYRDRWQEMVPGVIEESVALLQQLARTGIPLYALTNFSAEKFAESRQRMPFLGLFRDVVVSAEIGLVKPDPAIFLLIIDRHDLVPARTLFIDDSEENVRAAASVGLVTHHFRGADGLRAHLLRLGLLTGEGGGAQRFATEDEASG